MPPDNDIVKDANMAYEIAWRAWADWLDAAELDLRMYLGDQWDQDWKNYLTNRSRTARTFNRLARIIDIISGFERQKRKVLKAAAIGFDDDQVSTQMSDVLMGDMKASDAYDQISEAFKFGPLITGRNYLELFMGLNGRLQVRRVMYNHILPDPVAVDKDIDKDAGFIYHREMVTIQQAKRLLRGMRDSELELLAGKIDDKFPGIPWAMRTFSEKMIAYDRFWEKKGREALFVIDKQTGQEQEWPGTKTRLRETLTLDPQLAARFAPVNRWVDEIKMHIIVGGELMSSTTDPLGINEYPYIAMTGNWSPEIDDDTLKLQGLVRRLGDPQKEYNKRLCQQIDIIESHAQSGWLIEEGALVDDRQAYEAGQGGVRWVHK
ncbi:MAG TPA: hypothetical protein ENH62_15085, partial [Marinobacter sp.]|nr:hypothetical protein [Marinobacter sp.]